MTTTVLSEKGQVVIPAGVRKQLGLRRGDRFGVEVGEETVVLRLLPRSPLGRLRGAFKEPDGASVLEELVREHELDRQREDAR